MAKDIHDIAVILNPNAKGVTEAVLEQVSELIPPERLFLTKTMEDNQVIAERLLSEGTKTVFAGGGDGTVVAFINALVLAGIELGIPEENFPCIGVMRLGTGNAVAELVSSGSYLADLRSFIQNPHDDVHKMRMVEVEGRRFPFGGIGLDAEVLNDYKWVKDRAKDTAVSAVFQNVGGYFAAFFSRTVPRRVKHAVQDSRSKIDVRVASGEAYLMDSAGGRLKTFGPGELIYSGEMTCSMMGTCPYYGYGMKVLPYASELDGFMNFRVVKTPIQMVLANMKTVWDGTYRHEGIFDFLVEDIEIEMSEPLSYQEAGEAMGKRDTLRLKVTETPTHLIRFI